MKNATAIVGVGLRHEHYYDAIEDIAPIDFIEVHAENFSMPGGLVKELLHKASNHYEISIHATSLGLGSATPPNQDAMERLAMLCKEYQPILISDHACFNRAIVHGRQVHTGDLLPLRYNEESLDILARHVDMIQAILGTAILIENLSAYVPQTAASMSEFGFLAALCKKTGCQLLLDINNILVNQYNDAVMLNKHYPSADIEHALKIIDPISSSMIGEIHLAGTTPVQSGELMIDDHASTVSEDCWQLYRQVITKYGSKPTLIEWDQQLPPWQDLTALAIKAKQIQLEVAA